MKYIYFHLVCMVIASIYYYNNWELIIERYPVYKYVTKRILFIGILIVAPLIAIGWLIEVIMRLKYYLYYLYFELRLRINRFIFWYKYVRKLNSPEGKIISWVCFCITETIKMDKKAK